MEAYLAQRDELVAQDRSLRVDNKIHYSSGDVRERAQEIVRQVEISEERELWSHEHKALFPGMEFLTGKDIIKRSKLFKILEKMPKGALLHAHLDGTVNVEVLLRLAFKHTEMHVKVPKALTADTITSVLPTFCALSTKELTNVIHTSLTDPSYQDDSWVQVSQARKNFSLELGGPEGFDKWVTGALTINPTEAYQTHNSVPKIWEKFQNTFVVSGGLIRFMPVWYEYIHAFFSECIADGISYAEVRINFLFKTMVGVNGEDNVPHREWVLCFQRVLNEVKAQMKKEGREEEFFGARIIYTTIRFITPEELEWYLEDVISLKQEFPDLIAGFDLVGNENALQPLIYYMEPLLRFQQRTKELNLQIPFIFHAGETLGDGSKADMNLYDAILLGTKRIGHGFSLFKHHKLIEICRERKIAVECCPISNEILRLTSSVLMHPLPALINQGVPVALCSDDPAIFGNMGLSYDFYQVLVSSDLTTLTTLGEICRDSLEYSTLEPENKRRAISLWEKRWMHFCESVSNMDFN